MRFLQQHCVLVISGLIFFGLIGGYLLSGQSLASTESFQFSNSWISEIDIPIILRIYIIADVNNSSSLDMLIMYDGTRNDNPRLFEITLDPGEVYLDTDPLQTSGIKDRLFFDSLWIHLEANSSGKEVFFGRIEVSGRNRNLVEWVAYDLIDIWMLLFPLTTLTFMPLYILFYLISFKLILKRRITKTHLLFHPIAFILLMLGGVHLLVALYRAQILWKSLPYIPVGLTTIISGLLIILALSFPHIFMIESPEEEGETPE